MPFGQERVLVYTKSNHSVSLVPRQIVDSKSSSQTILCSLLIRNPGSPSPPLNEGPVSRIPWKTALEIKIPAALGGSEQVAYRESGKKWGKRSWKHPSKPSAKRPGEHTKAAVGGRKATLYTSEIRYARIDKNMTWKRLLGSVRRFQVVENPLI